MKHLLATLACYVAFASIGTAQLSNYLGPGILTNGAGNIGNRAGEQVDLRYYIDANGIYDNGIEPISVDSKGTLTNPGALEGVELMLGAYGSHSWKSSLLGLDYRGDFRHYNAASYYDGSDHNLILGYTYQKSRRLYFDLKGIGGSYSNYLGGVPGDVIGAPQSINQTGLLLFDNRTDFVQGFAGVTYLLSARASFTISGNGFDVHRQSSELIGMEGYGGDASFQYRVSRITSIGAAYNRSHYQYPSYYGQTNLNNYSVFVGTQFGPLWTFHLQGGVYQVGTQGLTEVALDPSVAAILGVGSVVQTFAVNSWVPSGQATLQRRFKQASLNFSYSRTIAPGNGVYLTSRAQNGSGGFSYTGINKIALDISGGYGSLTSVGQGLAPYSSYTGSLGITYNLTHALHAVARYDLRQQEITIAGFRATSYRVTLGLAFSPGSLPLSLW